MIKRLLDAGISLQQIRTAVQHLRERGTDDLTRVTLMSDGASVYECTSNDEVIDLLQGGQGVFGIAIGGVWREIEGSLAELPSEKAACGRRDRATERRAVRASPRQDDRLSHRSHVLHSRPSPPRGRGRLSRSRPGRHAAGSLSLPSNCAGESRHAGRTPKGQFLPGTSQAPGPRSEATLEIRHRAPTEGEATLTLTRREPQ